jgi:Cellulose binding domain
MKLALAVLLVLSALPGTAAARELPAVLVDHGAGAERAVMPGSGSAVVGVALSARPEAATTVTIELGQRSPGVVFVSSRRTLTFSPSDWDVPQPVRLISVSNFGSAEFTVSGPGVAAGVIRAYASTLPPPSNVNRDCQVTYTTQVWPGGLTTSVTLTNTGRADITDWTVVARFSGDERVVGSWNGVHGQYATAAALSAPVWNRRLAPGASVSLGFQAAFTERSGGPWLSCTPEPYLAV